MAITLKVTPAKLKSTAAQLQSQGNSIKNCTSQMTTLVNSLSGQIWSGDAANSYKKRFNGLNDDIAKLNKMCQEHVKDLQEIAANYESAEKANQSAASALASDVII